MYKNKLMVSVFMMAYNHERFIAQALEGVLKQTVNFTYQIVIGEDCSTDNTREIVEEYAQNFPDKFKLILHQKNVGALANQMAILNACSGKYIAICEGDDYWTDPLKLQKQVDFMESHTDYVLTHSDVIYVNSKGEVIEDIMSLISTTFKTRKKGIITKHLVKENFIITATVLILKDSFLEAEKRIEENGNQVVNIDYTLFLELSRLGKIHYEAQKTTAYRILANSASHSSDINSRLRFIESTINISRFYNKKFSTGINERYFERVLLSAKLREFACRKLFSNFKRFFFKGLKSDKLNLLRMKNYYYVIILLFLSHKEQNG